MSAPVTCPNGHRWVPDPESAAEVAPRCPVCGTPSTTVLACEPPDPGDETAVGLPPPPRPAPAAFRRIADEAFATTDEQVRPGPPVPHGYEILECLGRGGMGVVYKARQLRPNRLVAIKMILAGRHASAEERARFLAEAEAVARLAHPAIVQLYEFGECDGAPFFSLELVEGGSLAERLAGSPQPPGEAARLVEQLARAVNYAHRQGVVHRDLKPANVLVQPAVDLAIGKSSGSLTDYLPKIADFGLAKRADLPNLTPAGHLLGTPGYMAPEQVAGQGGPPADVHALGAILYETLTGRPPYRGATHQDTLLALATVEPVAPSRLNPTVARDLDTICLKCLAKDPVRRYAAAAALADDLARFLAGEPIQARPIGPAERAIKWAKRRPAAATLIAVVAFVILGSLAAGAYRNRELAATANRERGLKLQAQRERDVAQRERRRADDFRIRTAENFQQARRAADELADVAGNHLADVPGMEGIRKKLLEQVLEVYREALPPESRDPVVKVEQGRALRIVANLYRDLGDRQAALTTAAESRRVFESLAADRPSDRLPRHELAMCANNEGTLHDELGESGLAEEAYRKSIEIHEALAEQVPGDPNYRHQLAKHHSNLAALVLSTDVAAAERSILRALELDREIVGRYPRDAEYRYYLARHERLLASVVRKNRDRTGETEAILRQALADARLAASAQPRNQDYAREVGVILNGLGLLLKDNGVRLKDGERLAEAETVLHEAAAHEEGLVRDFPIVADYKSHWGGALSNLAMGLYGKAKLEGTGEAESQQALAAATDLLVKAIAQQQAALAIRPGHKAYLQFLRNHHGALADVALTQGDHVQAASTAQAFALVFPDSADDRLHSAKVLVRCSSMVSEDARIAEPDRAARAEQYAASAVGMLAAAIERGYGDFEELTTNETFSTLRERADFQALLGDR